MLPTNPNPGNGWMAVTVRANTKLDEGLHLVALDRPFDFLPGQHVGLALDPGVEPRLYSLAGGPDDAAMEILFDIHPGGALTPGRAEVYF
ncbi:MAG: hypothetical protein BWK77_05845 [Verrucomicrobia bacterium A1]|nr:MAG: hypothetical protein BWK77_05845 [Verrucomicrobia bacterium A1]